LTKVCIADTHPKDESNEEDDKCVLNLRLAVAIENQSFRSKAILVHATLPPLTFAIEQRLGRIFRFLNTVKNTLAVTG